MDYSPVFDRLSDQYISTGTTLVNFQSDFTIEFWWNPTTLNAGEDQTFLATQDSGGGGTTPIRFWKTDNAGSHRLRLRCEEQNVVTATEHVEVEWDVNALISTSTWVHIAVAFDVSQAVATIAELYVDNVSQGNGTVVSGTDCSSILQSDAGMYIGSDGAGAAVDGKLFDFRFWGPEVRTSTEINDNYQHTFTDSGGGQTNLRVNLWKGGAHFGDAAFASWNHIWSEQNGPISFSADIPAGINQQAGTGDGSVALEAGEQGVYGSVPDSSVGGFLLSDTASFEAYSSLPFSGADGFLVTLGGAAGAAALVYRMRAFDSGLGRTVYWTTEAVDPTGAEYIGVVGPGPLSDIVVSNVICQG